MNRASQHFLFGFAAFLLTLDITWGIIGRFDVAWRQYCLLGLLSFALWVLGLFYDRQRPDPDLAAMLFGTSFLCAFSAGADFLNFLLLTVAGPRIDTLLASIDRDIGFHWPEFVAWAASHPLINATLHHAYDTSLPQIAVLIVCLGLRGQSQKIYGFCVALAVGATIAIGFWTLFPSFGAFSVYSLPSAVSSSVNAALDGPYSRELVALLDHGPSEISPSVMKGLIGFPSFHVVMALLTVWYARKLFVLRWLAVVLNVFVVISTPIHGGHHLVDLFGGLLTAMIAIAISGRVQRGDRTVTNPLLSSAMANNPLPSV